MQIYEKCGVDVDLDFVGASALIRQSMLAAAANVARFGGPALVTNVLRGGSVITVAAMTPLTIALVARPGIEWVEDLKGKKVGITRLGGNPHFALELILYRYAVKDVAILQMGPQPKADVGLRRGLCRKATRRINLLRRRQKRDLDSKGSRWVRVDLNGTDNNIESANCGERFLKVIESGGVETQ